MLNKFLSKPMFRHAITIVIAGAVCYFAYREYSKMIQRLEIIANELYKAKQEIISLKKQQNSNKQTKNIRNPYKTKNTKKKQLLSKKNIPTPPKVNPIKVNKQSSMERISKHLPTKSQQLQTIIENAHQEFTLTEDAKIIDVTMNFKVEYWKIRKYHCQRVYRDVNFFNEESSDLKTIWEKIEYYRKEENNKEFIRNL